MISPLLANIVLNQLDWTLHNAGFNFVRYADDFVVICPVKRQTQEALVLISDMFETELGLKLSPSKTNSTTYQKGYEFLGFFLSSKSRRIRDKSEKKFKEKVRKLTIRHHNLDTKTVEKLNQVIRGTANFFATEFSTNRWKFQKLDSWIRMRLRCMKTKRKNYNDNRKLKCGYFVRKLGLLALESFCTYRDSQDNVCYVIPRNGATTLGAAH